MASPGSQLGAKWSALGKAEPKLTRVAFKVSQLMEFCSVRELQNQTGHSTYDWPLVVAKETMDNAHDACEEAEVAPEITIIVEPGPIVIQDNAGGFAVDTIESILDYTIRVSSREGYVSPTRGAQGNAIKTILAMGYVLDRRSGSDGDAAGVTIVESLGVRHLIEFGVDHINNQPKIIHTTTASPIAVGPDSRSSGRQNRICWETGRTVSSSSSKPTPGLTRTSLYAGRGSGASSSTSRRLTPIGRNGALAIRPPRIGTTKAGCSATSPRMWRGTAISSNAIPCASSSLSFGDSPAPPFSARSWPKSVAHTSPSRASSAPTRSTIAASPGSWRRCADTASRSPRSGLASLAPTISSSFLEASGNAETFKYQQRKGVTSDGIPYVIEFGFGLHQSGLGRGGVARKFVTGANWSAAINNPFRRFGSTAEGLESTLAKVRANASQPVICALHLASAHIQYLDRGKSSIALADDAEQPDD